MAIAYLLITTIFSFFPSELPVNKTNMNYSSLVFGAVVILGMGYYLLQGRKVYNGPIVEHDIMLDEHRAIS